MRRVKERVEFEVARQRVLDYLDARADRLCSASEIADAIWPDHDGKPQGMGGAAARLMKKIPEVGWHSYSLGESQFWGYQRRSRFKRKV